MTGRRYITLLVCLAAVLAGVARVEAQVTPVTLQWFETSWRTMEDRAADAFMAGYGRVWTPPPSKGENGTASIGYNPFDRFDLGTPTSRTRYGTRNEFVADLAEQHKAGVAVFIDLVVNHNSTSDGGTPGFAAAGGYPGFVLSWGGDSNGDFHPLVTDCDSDPLNCRTSGLIDIAQDKNYTFYRHPVTAGDPNNIPAGTVYNRPDANNRQFYPDVSLPANGIGIHPYNLADPTAGDPYLENATGLLCRYCQWLLEVIGVDGFRIDAAKHVPNWFLANFYDAQVWNRGPRLLNGAQTTPFSFMEIYDGNLGWHSGYVCKNGQGYCNTTGGVQGNRDTLDFPLYWALGAQLNGTGLTPGWRNIVNASVDQIFDGNANNGSFGVQFVSCHDTGLPPPAQDNLAYAYILMRAGSPIVYFQAGEFGSVSFPAGGRGDALGGQFGNLITTLVNIHNEYGRGDYVERWMDNPGGPGNSNVLVFERSNTCLVGLNTRMDNGYDERTVQTNFPGGTRLRELTGNATDAQVDPNNDIYDVVTVGSGGSVTIRVPRNRNVNGVLHNKGYVIYGPINPTGTLTVTPVASTISADPSGTPNGTRRLTPISVITADSVEVRLETTDPDPLDPDKDDFAMLKMDGGIDLNGNGVVDSTDPSFVGYGFENFTTQVVTLQSGGINIGGVQKGLYRQTVDATRLSEGRHYLTVIAFRHRPGGSPAIFQTWRQVLYVDRQTASLVCSAPASGQTITTASYKFVVQSTDGTVTSANMFLDAAPGTDLVALAGGGQNPATQDDRYQFSRTFTGIGSGYHRLDVVVFEESGRAGVVSFAGIRAIINGLSGLGDFNSDSLVNNFDIKAFSNVLNAGGFDPRADLNGDGVVNTADRDLFVSMLTGGGG